jgi:cytochrome P450
MSNDADETPSFNFFSQEFARCPQPVYAQIRSACPVTRSAFDQPVLARYEDVAWALRHPEIFSSAMDLEMALGTQRPMIPQQIDPPAQTRYRRFLDPHFSRRKMEALVPSIRRNASALIDTFIDAGECEFDEAFAIPLPCTAFLELLGLPASDLDLFLELKDGIIRPQKAHPEALTDLEAAKAVRVASGERIYEYFEQTIVARERAGTRRDDLLSAILAGEIDGEKLTQTEILDICFLLLLAGLDTVTATLGCNIAYLAGNPQQRRRILERPELMPGAVEELMRWETPVTAVPRLVKRDVEVGGMPIKQGELVTLLIGAANTDESRFPGADNVDFERERNIHMAFGAGPHRCLGSHLARMELCVAMEEWHRRIPEYQLKPGETPRFSAGIREALYLPLVWER